MLKDSHLWDGGQKLNGRKCSLQQYTYLDSVTGQNCLNLQSNRQDIILFSMEIVG